MENIGEIFNKYFVSPIINHTGYNLVNTLVYAIIAIISVYLILKLIKKSGIKINSEFIIGTLSFVLLGSTVRVITDSIDSGIFHTITPLHKIILDSHIYDYGFYTSSPGIYIIIASMFLISLYALNKIKGAKIEHLKYIALILWIPHILLLIPLMKHVVYIIPIFILALVPAYLIYKYLNGIKYGLVVFAQGLDGAATFFMIDIFGRLEGIYYWEQHVVSRAIGGLFGTYFTFYLLKIIISSGIAYFTKREKMNENEKSYILLLIMIVGFAPGIRDVLRMTLGG